jgi:DNA-binding CsgD family transcriptional regulator
MSPQPANLDGHWEELETDEDGYRHFRAGPVEVRGYDCPDGFEPDGELVTTRAVHVHIERMDEGSWWIGLSWGKTGQCCRQLLVEETDLRSVGGRTRMTEHLTAGERRVIAAMRTARTEAEAAETLGLAPATVHAYLRSARGKRNVRTTRALVALEAGTHEQA